MGFEFINKFCSVRGDGGAFINDVLHLGWRRGRMEGIEEFFR